MPMTKKIYEYEACPLVSLTPSYEEPVYERTENVEKAATRNSKDPLWKSLIHQLQKKTKKVALLSRKEIIRKGLKNVDPLELFEYSARKLHQFGVSVERAEQLLFINTDGKRLAHILYLSNCYLPLREGQHVLTQLYHWAKLPIKKKKMLAQMGVSAYRQKMGMADPIDPNVE